MRTAIDHAGRIVIPKPIRDQLGLRGGEEVEVTLRDGVIDIEGPPTEMHLVERSGVHVAVPDQELPPLTTEAVRAAIERDRR